MKLEQQVVSLELSKKLKESGVKQESLFYWGAWGGGMVLGYEDKGEHADYDDTSYCSAFTVAELSEMLPAEMLIENIQEHLQINKYSIWAFNYGRRVVFSGHSDDTFADSLARFVIYLLENKLITL